MAETLATVAPEPHSTKDDLTQAVQLLSLIQDGMTVAEAGAKLGITRRTAFRRLSLVEVDGSGVVKLLQAKGLDFAEDWIKASAKAAEKGDHRAAKDALIHAKLIEPVGDSASSSTRIAIIIGTPDQPIQVQPPQVVDAQVVSE